MFILRSYANNVVSGNQDMKTITITLILLTLYSCGLDCIEKKKGMHKASQTIEQSKEIGVYSFEMQTNKSTFSLDSGLTFKINSAWVENGWSYECVDNNAVVKKDSFNQLVIDAKYNIETINTDYSLMEYNLSEGCHLGSRLDFGYSGQDTLTLLLTKDKTIIDTLNFIKKINH